MGAWADPKACYVWGLVYHANGSERYQDVGLVKVDMCVEGEDEATVTVYQRNNQFTGEPVFVKNPEGTREDDGTLLVVSRDADSDETALLVRGALEQPGLSVMRSPPDPTTPLLVFSLASTFLTLTRTRALGYRCAHAGGGGEDGGAFHHSF